MAFFVGKSAARQVGNKIDGIAKEIDKIAQNEIDRVADAIDNELKSCSREISMAEQLVLQIPQLMQRLVQQIGPDAPVHVKNVIASIGDELNSKVDLAIGNIREVKKNVVDVDKLTNQIDEHTDRISAKANEIDKLTNELQD